MQKWEYYSIRFSWYQNLSHAYTPDGQTFDKDEAHQLVNRLGREGWELVQIGQQSSSGQDNSLHQILWFKRPVE